MTELGEIGRGLRLLYQGTKGLKAAVAGRQHSPPMADGRWLMADGALGLHDH
jgi:hypothetical protein